MGPTRGGRWHGDPRHPASSPGTTAGHASRVAVRRARTGAVVLEVGGALDSSSRPDLESAMRQALDRAGTPPQVVLDLGALHGLDPDALDILLDFQHRVGEAGGDLRVLDPPPSVVVMLHRAALDEPD